MKKDDRVLHKSGLRGTVKYISNGLVYVKPDAMGMMVPYSESSLTVIEGEGDHGEDANHG